MRKIINIAITHPIAVLMLTLALAIFGWESLQVLETALLPEITYPEFFVVTEFAGGSPGEIEQHISTPIEGVLASLPGIQDVVSHSREGMSIVEAQFSWDIDFRFTLLRIREKVDAVRAQFPEGTERPFILDFNPNSAPVMELVVREEQTGLTGVADFAEQVLKPRFSQLDGIASAQVTGAPQQSVQIQLLPEKIQQYGVPVATVVNSIRQNLPEHTLSSRVMVGYAEYPLNVQVRVEDISQLREMPVILSDTSSIRLKYLANVVQAPLPQRTLTYSDTTRVLGLRLYKESGANTVNATTNALELIQTLEQEFPGLHLQVIQNQGAFVTQAINSLVQAIILGAILAFLVLLFFLKRLRLAVILIVVIPVSLLVTFVLLHLQGITLNIMSLGGLALGIGLIVDNGIYVTESIAGQIEAGDPEPVLSGTGKVARAIVGATLTTIAIFFPIIYVQGYASVLFQNQALTIIYTLLISLFAALTLLPTAIHSLVLRATAREAPASAADFAWETDSRVRQFTGRIGWAALRKIRTTLARGWRVVAVLLSRLGTGPGAWFDRWLDWVETRYHRILVQALDHPGRAGLIGLGMLLGAYGLSTTIPRQYWPAASSRYVSLELEVPMSMPFPVLRDRTEATLRGLTGLPEVATILTRVMDPSTSQSGAEYLLVQHTGYYTVDCLLVLARPVHSLDTIRDQLIAQIRLPTDHLFLQLTGNLQQEFGTTEQKNLVLYVSGERPELVSAASDDMAAFLNTQAACQNVSQEYGGAEIVQAVHPRPSAFRKYHITPAQLAEMVSRQTRGQQVGNWQQGNTKIPVMVFWQTPGTKALARVLDYPAGQASLPVPVQQLVRVQAEPQQQEITRVNGSRVVAVEADVSSPRLSGVVAAVDQWRQTHPHAGVEIRVAGESRRTAASFRALIRAFLLATIIVYLILAAQFESLIHPLNIMLTVPMGLMGAVLGLILFQQSLNVISLIGLVMLIGIGVNDAIVKVDYMNFLHVRQGKPLREAVLITSREKFRPVLMTSLTTIFAMLPMLLGLGGNTAFNRPLAATIIGGLLFTTALTLIYTPLLYEVFARSARVIPFVRRLPDSRH